MLNYKGLISKNFSTNWNMSILKDSEDGIFHIQQTSARTSSTTAYFLIRYNEIQKLSNWKKRIYELKIL